MDRLPMMTIQDGTCTYRCHTPSDKSDERSFKQCGCGVHAAERRADVPDDSVLMPQAHLTLKVSEPRADSPTPLRKTGAAKVRIDRPSHCFFGCSPQRRRSRIRTCLRKRTQRTSTRVRRPASEAASRVGGTQATRRAAPLNPVMAAGSNAGDVEIGSDAGVPFHR